MDRFIKFLDFLNILDYNKRISLTNLALIVLVGKLAISQSPDLVTVGSVAIAMANYMHKRVEVTKSNAQE